jgi:hypothetical protein
VKTELKRWFAQQLANVQSVKRCGLGHEVDVIVETWSTTLVHVHLIDAPVKARALKKQLQEATRIGVGTLFVVSSHLVPGDGDKLTPDESLMALHALFKDKFYTYRVDPDGPKVGQVHFKSIGRGDEVEAWYGPDITIRNLPCYRVWVKSPNVIKGDWLMANFGSEAFWKSTDYARSRDAFRQQRRSEYVAQTGWSTNGWGGAGSFSYTGAAETPRPPRRPQTKLERCYAQLGLPADAPHDEVKAAFRKMARELHPDVSKLPKHEAELRFKLINEAYAYIRVSNRW